MFRTFSSRASALVWGAALLVTLAPAPASADTALAGQVDFFLDAFESNADGSVLVAAGTPVEFFISPFNRPGETLERVFITLGGGSFFPSAQATLQATSTGLIEDFSFGLSLSFTDGRQPFASLAITDPLVVLPTNPLTVQPLSLDGSFDADETLLDLFKGTSDISVTLELLGSVDPGEVGTTTAQLTASGLLSVNFEFSAAQQVPEPPTWLMLAPLLLVPFYARRLRQATARLD